MAKIETDLTGWKKQKRGWLTDVKWSLCRFVRNNVKMTDRYGFRRGPEKGVRLDDHQWALVGGDGADLEFLWEMNCIFIRLDGVKPDNVLRLDAMIMRLIVAARDEYSCEQTHWYDDKEEHKARKGYQLWIARIRDHNDDFIAARESLRIASFIWHSAKARPLIVNETETRDILVENKRHD